MMVQMSTQRLPRRRSRDSRRPATPLQAARCGGPIDGLLDPWLFRALGDPRRASLLACLAKCGRACSVTEVAECCDIDFSVVSRHLALMARFGVLDAVRSGRSVLYRVRFETLSSRLRRLADALDACCPDGSCHPCRGACR